MTLKLGDYFVWFQDYGQIVTIKQKGRKTNFKWLLDK
jgi:hypothetical protein